MPTGFDSLQTLDNQEILPDDVSRVDLGYSDAHLTAPYLVQQLTTTYAGDEGLLQIPVAAPVLDPTIKVPCKIVRAHAPVMRKIVSYNYVRLALIPDIPPPETDDLNLRLLDHRRNPMASWHTGNGIPAYAISGEYEYAMYTPLTTEDAMPFGKNTAFVDGAVDEDLTPENYDVSVLG